jgi:dipeptidyl aminopeptidase/acylaminoacyl peptidase
LLAGLPYVESTKIGMQGHSFGGYDVNYLITHTHLFAAAMSGSGLSDFVSEYGVLRRGASAQNDYEIGQMRVGATLWERPDLFIKNSPVFSADKVTTPVLLMNNINDVTVPFEQNGLEFFTALRRMGKKAWMLQYDEEGHILSKEENQMDLTIRMKQFFDHYLMGKPAPVWMTRGIPASQKGSVTGYEYDTGIKTPGPGLLSPEEQETMDSLQYRKPLTLSVNN